MKIKYQVFENELKKTFTTNHRTIRDYSQIVIFIEWSGFLGIGTALLPYNSLEKDNFIREFESRLPLYEKHLNNENPFSLERILGCLRNVVPPAELSAVDLALHDLLGKALGKPISAVFGLGTVPSRIASGVSLSAGVTPQDYLKQLDSALLKLPILKVKMKSDTEPGVISAIRKIYHGRIWADVNCGWTFEKTKDAMPMLSDCGVEILEQPLPVGQWQKLQGIRGRYPVKLVADEDCTNIESVFRLAPAFDGVALKLHKSGGLSEARGMLSAARALNLKIMLGCRTESCIGISAIGQLIPAADWIDLDGSCDLVDQRFNGFKLEDGELVSNEFPGIGVSANA